MPQNCHSISTQVPCLHSLVCLSEEPNLNNFQRIRARLDSWIFTGPSRKPILGKLSTYVFVLKPVLVKLYRFCSHYIIYFEYWKRLETCLFQNGKIRRHFQGHFVVRRKDKLGTVIWNANSWNTLLTAIVFFQVIVLGFIFENSLPQGSHFGCRSALVWA